MRRERTGTLCPVFDVDVLHEDEDGVKAAGVDENHDIFAAVMKQQR